MAGLNEQRITLELLGEKLVGILTTPAKSTKRAALLLHGGPGGTKEGPSDLYVRLAELLAGVGIASARFDFQGEGESGGDYVRTSPTHQAQQYAMFIAWMNAQGFDRIGVVGESFGGTCALGGYRPDQVQALVLLWPAVWLLDGTFQPLLTDAAMADLRDRGYFEVDGLHVGQTFVDELHSHRDRETELRNVVAPTLLVHGDADSEVPVHQSVNAFDILSEPKRLVVVPGGDHCLRQPDEQALVVRETTDWLSAHL